MTPTADRNAALSADRAEPQVGRSAARPRPPVRLAHDGDRPLDLPLSAAEPRLSRRETAEDMRLTAGDRLIVSSELSEDGDPRRRPGALRMAMWLVVGILAVAGVVSLLHTFGISLPG